MNREPMKHLSLKLGDLPIMKNNGDTYELELCRKAVASVMKDVEKADNKVIYEAMIEFAKKENFTDIYLIDEDFLRSSITHEIERRRRLNNEIQP